MMKITDCRLQFHRDTECYLQGVSEKCLYVRRKRIPEMNIFFKTPGRSILKLVELAQSFYQSFDTNLGIKNNTVLIMILIHLHKMTDRKF